MQDVDRVGQVPRGRAGSPTKGHGSHHDRRRARAASPPSAQAESRSTGRNLAAMRARLPAQFCRRPPGRCTSARERWRWSPAREPYRAVARARRGRGLPQPTRSTGSRGRLPVSAAPLPSHRRRALVETPPPPRQRRAGPVRRRRRHYRRPGPLCQPFINCGWSTGISSTLPDNTRYSPSSGRACVGSSQYPDLNPADV